MPLLLMTIGSNVPTDIEGMRISDLPTRFETGLTFPLARSTLIEQAGDLEIEAPDRDDSVTLASVIERCDDTTFSSASVLYDTIVGNLDDAYIGRKFYDDRGGNPIAVSPGRQDETVDQSF